MVDIHCHMVPGVDDGAASVEIAIAMMEQAASLGVTHIVTTPHIRGRLEDLSVHEFHQHAFESLAPHIGTPAVKLGCEVRIVPEMAEIVGRKEFTANEGGKYLLFELPFAEVPTYALHLIFELRLRGVTPIIAHPERIAPILKDPGIAVDFVARGALLQLTNGSLLGELGEPTKALSLALLEHGLVSIVASDAHNVTKRPFTAWTQASELLSEIEGRQSEELGTPTFRAIDLTTTNPRAVFDGTELPPPDLSLLDHDKIKQQVRVMAAQPKSWKKRWFYFRN